MAATLDGQQGMFWVTALLLDDDELTALRWLVSVAVEKNWPDAELPDPIDRGSFDMLALTQVLDVLGFDIEG